MYFLNNSVHKNMFHFRITVGKGGFGRVWKVQNKKTKETLALKIMSKAKILAKRSVQSVMNEKGFLINIDNEYPLCHSASLSTWWLPSRTGRICTC